MTSYISSCRAYKPAHCALQLHVCDLDTFSSCLWSGSPAGQHIPGCQRQRRPAGKPLQMHLLSLSSLQHQILCKAAQQFQQSSPNRALACQHLLGKQASWCTVTQKDSLSVIFVRVCWFWAAACVDCYSCWEAPAALLATCLQGWQLAEGAWVQ